MGTKTRTKTRNNLKKQENQNQKDLKTRTRKQPSPGSDWTGILFNMAHDKYPQKIKILIKKLGKKIWKNS